MGVEFYFLKFSPPCRGVWMVLEALKVPYSKHIIDIFKNEQKTENYKEINCRQRIPAIKDGSFSMGESRAIATYLCNQYGTKGPGAKLYPQDPKERAVVDSVLYIDENMIEKVHSYVNIFGVLEGGKVKTENVNNVKEVLKCYDDFLTKRKYIAADHLTIADFFAYVTVSLLALADYNDFEDYPKVVAWKKKMAELPYFKLTCEEPMATMYELYQGKLKK